LTGAAAKRWLVHDILDVGFFVCPLLPAAARRATCGRQFVVVLAPVRWVSWFRVPKTNRGCPGSAFRLSLRRIGASVLKVPCHWIRTRELSQRALGKERDI